jgi:hypothetical protein
MKSTSKAIVLAAIAAAILGGALVSGQQLALAGKNAGTGNEQNKASEEDVPLKEAKLNIEHNAKDNDTGFQGFIDSEGWNKITATGPDGKILEFEGKGELGSLGLTELFFESVEPENADVPIDELLQTLPAGDYEFEGSGIEVGEKTGTTSGTASLTHVIPAGPVLLTPAEEDEVPVDDLFVSWEPVETDINGSEDITIIAYQLIIEKEVEPDQHMIGKFGLSMYLPASVTEITIPGEFLEPGTDYEWEVLAIEESGNQTLNSSSFSTESEE